jgi:hypothetical protein
MADIFLSYASSDRAKADALRRWFEAAGWSVWWDRETDVGGDWESTLRRELEKARVVVVLWCPQSRRSAWVLHEARSALEAGKLVQVRATGLPLPSPFGARQAVRFEAWDGETWHHEAPRLIAYIAKKLGTKPPSAAPPTFESSVVDRTEVAQLVFWFCAVRAEFFRLNALGARIDPSVTADMEHSYVQLKRMLDPIDDESLHEMIGWYVDTLEAFAPSKLPQGLYEREVTSPFAARSAEGP